MKFEVNGEWIVLSDAAIRDIQTAEMLQVVEKDLQETIIETEDRMMITTLTVLAVVVTLLVVGFAVACCVSFINP